MLTPNVKLIAPPPDVPVVLFENVVPVMDTLVDAVAVRNAPAERVDELLLNMQLLRAIVEAPVTASAPALPAAVLLLLKTTLVNVAFCTVVNVTAPPSLVLRLPPASVMLEIAMFTVAAGARLKIRLVELAAAVLLIVRFPDIGPVIVRLKPSV